MEDGTALATVLTTTFVRVFVSRAMSMVPAPALADSAASLLITHLLNRLFPDTTQTAGRARRGPAPLNLEIPEYEFENDAEEKLIIG